MSDNYGIVIVGFSISISMIVSFNMAMQTVLMRFAVFLTAMP